MFDKSVILFGDHVRVLATSVTEELGLAGGLGQVYGWTTPSQTYVEVIGETSEDYAVNVFFDDRDEAHWFAPELLEFIDHAPGTEIRLEGVSKKWVRTAAGAWVESDAEDVQGASKPWWKIW